MSIKVSEANIEFMFGNYEIVIHLLKNENLNRPKILSMLGYAYYNTGKFEESYRMYNKLFNDDDVYKHECGVPIQDFDPTGQKIWAFLTKMGFESLIITMPETLNYDCVQSEENLNELYTETIEFFNLVKKSGIIINNDPEQDLDILYDYFDEIVDEGKEAFFTGEIFLAKGDLSSAYDCYFSAAINDSGKALYYAYAGNMLYKMKQSTPYTYLHASVLINRAIKLEYTNPRWHFYSGLNLLTLGLILSKDDVISKNLIVKAREEFEISKQEIKPYQMGLLKEVNKMLELI